MSATPTPSSLTPISLTRFLMEEKRAGRINPHLRLRIDVVARACKRISVEDGNSTLGGVLGDAGHHREHDAAA